MKKIVNIIPIIVLIIALVSPAQAATNWKKIRNLKVTKKLSLPRGVITSKMIKNGTITGSDIAAGAVTGSDIANTTITGSDLAANIAITTTGITTLKNQLVFSGVTTDISAPSGQGITMVTTDNGKILLNGKTVVVGRSDEYSNLSGANDLLRIMASNGDTNGSQINISNYDDGMISIIPESTGLVRIDNLTLHAFPITESTALTSYYNGLLVVTTGDVDVTLTLPDISGDGGMPFGRYYIIKKIDTGSGNVIVDTADAATIDGSASLNMGSTQYHARTIVQYATNWYVANAYP